MFDAQTLQCKGTTATIVKSPWFPRGGDYGIFTLEVVQASSASSSMKVEIQLMHKNNADAGDGANVGSPITVTCDDIGRVQGDITAGFKELVRYEITLVHSSGGSDVNWAIFRILAPVWYDHVKA